MKWSIKKTVAGVLAAVFFAVGIYFAYGAIKWHWDNKKADQEVYWQTPVDLSRKGIYTAAFQVIHDQVHGQWITVETGSSFASEEEVAKSLEGIVVQIQIIDERKESVFRKNYASKDIVPLSRDGAYLLHFRFGLSLLPGTYEIRFEVMEPARGLAGQSQKLVLENQFCGLEGLIVLVFGAIAAVSLLIATGLGILFYCLLKKRDVVSTIG